MTAQRWSIIGMVALYLLLTVNAALSGLTLASAMRTEAAVVESEVFTLSTEVFIHGYCVDDVARMGLAGVTLELRYEGRFIRSKTTVAGGEFGFGDTAKLGLFLLRISPPPGWGVTGIEPIANTTDFGFVGDMEACQFRVSPAGGVTEIRIYLRNIATPTATWIPTPTFTVTPHAPTPTFTAMPVPVTPSPTWTPGPTPTTCFVQASAEEIAVGVAAMSAQHPLGNDPVTRWAIDSGLGWPMTVVECVTIGGEQVCGQLFSQFTIVFRRANGCIAIVDSGSIQGVMP
jgi:hypothetical protein